MKFDVVLFNDADLHFGFNRSGGAYCISSTLRKSGYETLVINYSSSITWDKFKQLIDLSIDETTLVVGFSVSWFETQIDIFPNATDWQDKSLSTNFQRKNIKPYVDYIKSVNPNIKVIAGGFMSHFYTQDNSLDHVFIGYSESQMLDFMKSVENNTNMDKIINHDVKGKNFDFKSSYMEYTDWDLLHPEEVLLIEFGRGCIFKCAFCSFPLLGSKTIDYIKYQEVIYNELLTNYEKWGIKKYYIIDDTFNDSVQKLELICDVVERLPFQPEFMAYIRIDLFAAHPEMANLLKRIGLKSANFGLETWNVDTAKAIRKGGSLERKIQALKIARDCWGDEITITTNLVIGLPNDTIESLDRFVEWYEEEGYKYINDPRIVPLYITPKIGITDPNVIYTSDIDKNRENFGYKSATDDTYVFNVEQWEKDSNAPGDIKTRKQAEELVEVYTKKLSEVIKKVTPNKINNINIMNDIKEKFNVKKSGELLGPKMFEVDYYPRLIKMLKDRKLNDKRY